MKIGITYNLKDEVSPLSILSSEHNEEFDTKQTIDAICNIFEKKKFETVKLGGGIDIISRLKKEKVGFVFNIAEGYYGRNRESHTPSILEMLNIPYSGSDPLTLGLTLDKTMAKKLMLKSRIPTPAYSVAKKIEDLCDAENRLSYPIIVKPAWEGSSKGIYNSSRVSGRAELESSAESLFRRYPNQPVLLEEYIKGREITVGVIGNDCPQILGLMEITSKNDPYGDFLYSLEVKREWKDLVEYISPPGIPRSLEEKIRRYCVVAFKEFGCRDVARIDFKISEYNEPFLLEINPLPGLSPENSDLPIMAQKLGMKYEDLIIRILYHAFSRYGISLEQNKVNDSSWLRAQ